MGTTGINLTVCVLRLKILQSIERLSANLRRIISKTFSREWQLLLELPTDISCDPNLEVQL